MVTSKIVENEKQKFKFYFWFIKTQILNNKSNENLAENQTGTHKAKQINDTVGKEIDLFLRSSVAKVPSAQRNQISRE